ncbi:MAG TPA: methyltransferase [Bacteroidales bacterium]|nr:methyltransferase [Bacteroidales bacterium]
MANDFFNFKQFTVRQKNAAFKVGTDGVLLGACADLGNAASILDIGTGTGLIALMCAQRSDAEIIAIEPDHASFLQAKENFESSPWRERLSAVNSDLEKFAGDTRKKFDVIISNPPYFRNSLINPEPGKARLRHAFSLSSDDLLENSVLILAPEGSLQVILPYEEGTIFMTEASGKGLFCNSMIKVKATPQGKVIRLIMKFETVKRKPHESFLAIETGTRHSYTREYMELTREYYLKF